eukprot:377395-Amphidinium_carterae.1
MVSSNGFFFYLFEQICCVLNRIGMQNSLLGWGRGELTRERSGRQSCTCAHAAVVGVHDGQDNHHEHEKQASHSNAAWD